MQFDSRKVSKVDTSDSFWSHTDFNTKRGEIGDCIFLLICWHGFKMNPRSQLFESMRFQNESDESTFSCYMATKKWPDGATCVFLSTWAKIFSQIVPLHQRIADRIQELISILELGWFLKIRSREFPISGLADFPALIESHNSTPQVRVTVLPSCPNLRERVHGWWPLLFPTPLKGNDFDSLLGSLLLSSP